MSILRLNEVNIFMWWRAQLFDYIADCIASFVREHHLEKKSLPLGFTFSFPCRQEGLAAGRLVKWSKEFNCSGVIGQDVVSLLHDAIQRKTVRILWDVSAFCSYLSSVARFPHTPFCNLFVRKVTTCSSVFSLSTIFSAQTVACSELSIDYAVMIRLSLCHTEAYDVCVNS